MNTAAWIALITAVEPGLIALVRDLIALMQKYPGMTPDQLGALVQQLATSAKAVNDETLELIDGATKKA